MPMSDLDKKHALNSNERNNLQEEGIADDNRCDTSVRYLSDWWLFREFLCLWLLAHAKWWVLNGRLKVIAKFLKLFEYWLNIFDCSFLRGYKILTYLIFILNSISCFNITKELEITLHIPASPSPFPFLHLTITAHKPPTYLYCFDDGFRDRNLLRFWYLPFL